MVGHKNVNKATSVDLHIKQDISMSAEQRVKNDLYNLKCSSFHDYAQKTMQGVVRYIFFLKCCCQRAYSGKKTTLRLIISGI